MEQSLNKQDMDCGGGSSCMDWMLFGGQLLSFPEPPLNFDVISGSVLQQDLISAAGDGWLSGADPTSTAVDEDALLQDVTWPHTANVGDSSGLLSVEPDKCQHSPEKDWQYDEDENLKCIDMYNVIVEHQSVLDKYCSDMLPDNINELAADETIDLSSFDVIAPDMPTDEFSYLSGCDDKYSTGIIDDVVFDSKMSAGNSDDGLLNDIAKAARVSSDYLDSTDVSSKLMGIMSSLSQFTSQQLNDSSAIVTPHCTTANVSLALDLFAQSQSSLPVLQDSLMSSEKASTELHLTSSQNSLASQASLDGSVISSDNFVTSQVIGSEYRHFASVSKITSHHSFTPAGNLTKHYNNTDRLMERKLRKKEQNCRAALKYRQKKTQREGTRDDGSGEDGTR